MSCEKAMERFDRQATVLWQGDSVAWDVYLAKMRPQLWEMLSADAQRAAALVSVPELEIQTSLLEHYSAVSRSAEAASQAAPPLPPALPVHLPTAPAPKRPAERKKKPVLVYMAMGVLVVGAVGYGVYATLEDASPKPRAKTTVTAPAANEVVVQATPQGTPQASASDEAEMLFRVGVSFLREEKYAQAVDSFRRAERLGSVKAQDRLGDCYRFGYGVTKDDAEAAKWYRKAADQENPDAQFSLGFFYSSGRGVAQNDTEAVKWFRKSADQGDAVAQYRLGACYYFGNGVSVNFTEAVKWFRKAANQDHDGAQWHLGHCYYYGKGVAENFNDAAKWYRKAAEQDNADAQFGIGMCYWGGNGVSRNDFEGTKWFRKAAEQNHAGAQIALGMAYSDGTGVARDDIEAYKWVHLASEQDDDAKADKLKLEGKLTLTQVSQGRWRAEEWRKQFAARQSE